MGCVCLAVLVVVLGLADAAALDALANRRAGRPWWAALAALAVLGVTAGVWCGFYCEYRASERLRVISFPVPAAVLHWEDGNWVDYITPEPRLVALSNAVVVALVAVLPVGPAFLLSRWWEKRRAGRGRLAE